MPPNRQPDRQPYAGDSVRERPLLDESELGPMRGRVQVVPVRAESRWAAESGVFFAVECEWTGPGLPELPPADGPVAARDTFTLADRELALAVAGAAGDDLRAGRVPDIRGHARRLESRS